MPTGSDLLVAALENEGVSHIFGVPGEENLDVVESLRTVDHPAGADPPRTGRGVHGGDLRAADGQAGRVPDHARPGGAEPDHRRPPTPCSARCR